MVAQPKPVVKTFRDMNRYVAKGSVTINLSWKIRKISDDTYDAEVRYERVSSPLTPGGTEARHIYPVETCHGFLGYQEAWHACKVAAMQWALKLRPLLIADPNYTPPSVGGIDPTHHQAPWAYAQVMRHEPHTGDDYLYWPEYLVGEQWRKKPFLAGQGSAYSYAPYQPKKHLDPPAVVERELHQECPICGHLECGHCWRCRNQYAYLVGDLPISQSGYPLDYEAIQEMACTCWKHVPVAYSTPLEGTPLVDWNQEYDAPPPPDDPGRWQEAGEHHPQSIQGLYPAHALKSAGLGLSMLENMLAACDDSPRGKSRKARIKGEIAVRRKVLDNVEMQPFEPSEVLPYRPRYSPGHERRGESITTRLVPLQRYAEGWVKAINVFQRSAFRQRLWPVGPEAEE